MKSILLVVVAFMVTLLPVKAQDNFFESGYIIIQSDTIRGYIERTDEIRLSKEINFKPALAGIEKMYTPQELLAYGFEKDQLHFESVAVTLRKQNKISQDKRFAKKMLGGLASLYKLQLPESDRTTIFKTENTFVYVLRKGEQFYTLGQYEFRQGNYVGIQKQYIGMLTAVLNDCPESIKNIHGQQFKDRAILERIVQYNSCKEPDKPTVAYTYKIKAKVKHGPQVAYGKLFAIPQPRDKQIAFGNSKFESSNSFSAGYYFEFLKPDISQRVAVRTGLDYLFQNYTIKTTYTNGSFYTQDFKNHSVLIPVNAQFNFNQSEVDKNFPFLTAGFTAAFSSSPDFKSIIYNPLLDISAGMYTGNFRYSLLLQSYGIQLRAGRTINLCLAYNLGK